MIDTKKLRELAEAATPGPWHWDSDPVKGDPTGRIRYRVTTIGKTITQVYYSSFEGGHTNAEWDARLIAAMNPKAIIAILDELDRMTAERDALKGDSERFRWITDDHQDPRVRTDLHDLFDRLPVMSYSAACAAIDSAIRASNGGLEMKKPETCLMCRKPATWIRNTQFAGEHPFCDEHARQESDFQENDSYKFWENIKEEAKK